MLRLCGISALLLHITCGMPPEPTQADIETYKDKAKASLEAMKPPVTGNASLVKSAIMTKLERGGLVEDWEKLMQGFTPDLMLTFPLAARTDEFFFEEVNTTTFIRGAFFASATEGESSVDFQITDPSGDIIHEKSGAADGLFHFNARKTGTYTFMVSNHKWMEGKTVTLTIGRGTEETLHSGHLDDVESIMGGIERKLRDIQTESTYLWIRQQAHMKTVESVQRRVFWFCLLELLALSAISVFQVFYIKGLLSDRRVL